MPAPVWTSITYSFLSVLTSAKMTQNQDNFRAVAQGKANGGVDTGAANAYVVSSIPGIDTLFSGLEVWFVAANTNTAASTINVNSLGVTAIKKSGSAALVANDIMVGHMIRVIFDGTNFQLANPDRRAVAYGTATLDSGGRLVQDANTVDGFHASQAAGIGEIPVNNAQGNIEAYNTYVLKNATSFLVKDNANNTRAFLQIDASNSFLLGDVTRQYTGYISLVSTGENALSFVTQANNNRTIWHAGNDGAGSGLAADTIETTAASPGGYSGSGTPTQWNNISGVNPGSNYMGPPVGWIAIKVGGATQYLPYY